MYFMHLFPQKWNTVKSYHTIWVLTTSMRSISCIYVIGVKPFKCELCDKRFARDQQRRVHQVVHTGDKLHLCCECGQSFGSASTLIDHKKRKHLFMRDHQCQKCNKGFFTRQELEAHSRVHTGDKPYQCPVSFETNCFWSILFISPSDRLHVSHFVEYVFCIFSGLRQMLRS